MIRLMFIILLSVLAVADTARADRPSKPLPPEYNVLTFKSIFARDRRTAIRSTTAPAPTTAPAATQTFTGVPIFVGVVLEDDGCVAFLEDPTTGTITQARVGDVLPGQTGVVHDITLDYLEISVPAGVPVTSAPSATESAATAPAATAPAATASTAPAANASKRIWIGQDLNGVDAARLTESAAPAAAPLPAAPSGDGTSHSTTAPSAALPPRPPGGGPVDDITERLRRRRQQELRR